VLTPQFTADACEEIFYRVAMSEPTLARRLEGNTGQSYLTLPDLLVALAHVAFHRFAAETYGRRPDTELSEKVMILLSECLSMSLYPAMQRKIEPLYHAASDKVRTLLEQGRRLTEQTLDACQYKRVRAATVSVEAVTVCRNLQKWKLLRRDFNIQARARLPPPTLLLALPQIAALLAYVAAAHRPSSLPASLPSSRLLTRSPPSANAPLPIHHAKPRRRSLRRS